MKKIRFSRKTSFLNKIRISYGILIVLPVLILGIFVLYSSTEFIKDQQLIQAKESIERNYQNIENQMAICEKSALYVVSNATLRDFLNIPDDQYMKRNKVASNVSSLLYNAWLSNQFFSKIEVYSDKNIATNNAIFKKTSDMVDDLSWYEKTMSTKDTLWWYSNGKYYLTRRIVSSLPEKKLGVIRIWIKDNIFSDSMYMFAKIPVEIHILNENQPLFQYKNKESSKPLKFGYEETRNLGNTEWKISYGIHEGYFSNMNHPSILISLVIVLLLLVSGMIAVNLSTKSLLKYFYKIIDDVKKVKEDNFEIQVDESSEDEIGELAKSINQMLRKIQMLINEVYKSKLDKKSLELNLLQSKMNPHFLYNNLSAINWIAIEKGEDRIYEITTQLATFYRTALNKGINIDKLSVEVENIKAYIRLQLMAHDDSFEVVYDIDEKLFDINIPIFIMQPLVENAIEHGIDALRDKNGKISIHVTRENGNIVIRIKDNGRDLYEKIGNNRMPEANYGYGVSNVHKRIQLLCGEEYGVVITANKAGTTSMIQIREDFIALEKKS